MISPFDFGAMGNGATDDGEALQAFLDHVTVNDGGVADVTGNFFTSQPLTLGPALTKTFVGRCSIRFVGMGGAGLTVRGWTGGRWEQLVLTAPARGVTDYASKTWHTGLHVTDGTGRGQFGRIEGSGWAFALAAASGGNTTATDFGIVKATDCGSGHINGVTRYGASTEWSAPVNTGTSGSVAQSCTLTVDTLPPPFIIDGYHGATGDAPYFLRISDNAGRKRLHHILDVDPEASTVKVFPWVDPATAPGIADYVWGGALYMHGADSNVHEYSLIDAMRCGIALSAASLYAPHGRRLITQTCGAAVVIGRAANGAVLGGKFDGCYFEANTEDIVYLSRPGSSNVYHWFGSEYALDLSKCYVAGAPRTAGTFADSPAFAGFENTILAHRGRLHRMEKRRSGASNGTTQTPVIDRPDMQLVLTGDTFTITPSLNSDLNRLFGYDALQIVAVGSGPSGAPTGVITFPPPSGYSLNGGAASVTFAGLTSAARFVYRFDVANQAAVVARI